MHQMSIDEAEDVIGLVHGDGFVTLADDRGQDFFEECLTKRYQYSKKGRLGPRSTDSREIKVLNRYMRWPVEGDPEYEADPRHAQVIAKGLNLEGGMSVTSPIVKYDVHNDGELKGRMLNNSRSLTMRRVPGHGPVRHPARHEGTRHGDENSDK